VYDTLLFLHVLAAFALMVTAVTYSAVAIGAPTGGRALGVANLLWDVGGLGTLVFGIWLAIDVDDYEIWDGWILGALVLFALATELGRRAKEGYAPAKPLAEGGAVAVAERASLMHWLRTLAVIGLLVLMIWKPGA
jgi:hypothetical protein